MMPKIQGSVNYALLGIGMMLLGGVLYVFPEMGNSSVDNALSKGVRMVEITTFGLANAVASNLTGSARTDFKESNFYGNPTQAIGHHTKGEGIRKYYTWGLWSRCASYNSSSALQYCTPITAGQILTPTMALLEDVPPAYAAALAALLAEPNSHMRSDKSLATWSRMGGFAVLSAIIHIVPLVIVAGFVAAGKGPKILPKAALGMTMPVFMSGIVGTSMYTAMVSSLQSSLNGRTIKTPGEPEIGLKVSFGNAIGLLWFINVILIAGTVMFFLAYKDATKRAAQQDYGKHDTYPLRKSSFDQSNGESIAENKYQHAV